MIAGTFLAWMIWQAFLPQMYPFPGPGRQAASLTFNVIQHVPQFCSAATFCSTTVTSTGTGNLLVVLASAYNSTSPTLSSVTGDSTWTHPAGCYATGSNGGSNTLTSDCAYILSSAGGATTITWTWSGTIPDMAIEVFEVSRNFGSFALDTLGENLAVGCGTTCAGIALTLGGSNDFIAQGANANISVSAITSPYTGDFPTGFGFAWSNNTASGAAPNWTQSASGNVSLNAIAFK